MYEVKLKHSVASVCASQWAGSYVMLARFIWIYSSNTWSDNYGI